MLTRCSAPVAHISRTRAGSDTITVRPKNGTLISKMRPCRSIQLCMALRRKNANRMPVTSLGERTCGGLTLFGVGVAHGSATAAIVTRIRRDDLGSRLLQSCRGRLGMYLSRRAARHRRGDGPSTQFELLLERVFDLLACILEVRLRLVGSALV